MCSRRQLETPALDRQRRVVPALRSGSAGPERQCGTRPRGKPSILVEKQPSGGEGQQGGVARAGGAVGVVGRAGCAAAYRLVEMARNQAEQEAAALASHYDNYHVQLRSVHTSPLLPGVPPLLPGVSAGGLGPRVPLTTPPKASQATGPASPTHMWAGTKRADPRLGATIALVAAAVSPAAASDFRVGGRSGRNGAGEHGGGGDGGGSGSNAAQGAGKEGDKGPAPAVADRHDPPHDRNPLVSTELSRQEVLGPRPHPDGAASAGPPPVARSGPAGRPAAAVDDVGVFISTLLNQVGILPPPLPPLSRGPLV